jgi:ABC-type cobalamin/Fe3+-siderophores transport system ATPase subunit
MSYKITSSIEVSVNNINKTLLQNAELEIKSKELVYLRSKNGSGKSTFVKALVGYQSERAKKGSSLISLLKKNMRTSNRVISKINFLYNDELQTNLWVAKNTSYMSQDFPYFMKNLTILDYVFDKLEGSVTEEQFNNLRNNEIFISNIENLLRYFFYNKDFNYTKFSKNSKILKMSGGELQVISIMASIVRAIFTRILILDEPFNNLGDKEKRKSSDLITYLWDQKDELVIILISHCNILDLTYFKNLKVLKIDDVALKFKETTSEEYSCIGKASNGYYNKEDLLFNKINLKEKSYE